MVCKRITTNSKATKKQDEGLKKGLPTMVIRLQEGLYDMKITDYDYKETAYGEKIIIKLQGYYMNKTFTMCKFYPANRCMFSTSQLYILLEQMGCISSGGRIRWSNLKGRAVEALVKISTGGTPYIYSINLKDEEKGNEEKSPEDYEDGEDYEDEEE